MSSKRAHEKERKRFLHILAATLRRLRAEHELTQMGLADLANLHRTEISRLENARTDPRLSTLVILAHALGSTLDELAAGLPVPVERKPPPHRKQRP